MMNYSEKLQGNCFVYIRGNDKDIELYYELVRLSKEDSIILYPESSFTFVDTVCYIPYVKTVVTENPYIISTYSRKSVWVLDDGKWGNPRVQTYGASVGVITESVLKYDNSIPMGVISGKEGIELYKVQVKSGRLYDESYE